MRGTFVNMLQRAVQRPLLSTRMFFPSLSGVIIFHFSYNYIITVFYSCYTRNWSELLLFYPFFSIFLLERNLENLIFNFFPSLIVSPPILSHPILSYPILPYPILSYPILSISPYNY